MTLATNESTIPATETTNPETVKASNKPNGKTNGKATKSMATKKRTKKPTNPAEMDLNQLLKNRESATKELGRYNEEINKIQASADAEIAKVQESVSAVETELNETNKALAKLLGVTGVSGRKGSGRKSRIDMSALAAAIPTGKAAALSSSEIATKMGVDKVTSVQLRAAGAKNIGEKRAAKWYK